MKTFTKEERLCSKKYLDLLFHKGSSFLCYPFRVSYLFVEQEHSFPVQVVINVAKKRYRHATDRNLIKRRTREAYRLQKQELLYLHLQKQEELLLLGIQYVGKEIHLYTFFEKKMKQMMLKLIEEIGNENH